MNNVETLTALQANEEVILKWPHPETIPDKEVGENVPYRDLTRYEIREGKPGIWAYARVIQRTSCNKLRIRDWGVGANTFMVRALDKDGQYAPQPTSINLTTVHPAKHESKSIRDEKALAWPGTKTGTTVDGDGFLVLSGSNLSGTYESPWIDLTENTCWRLGFLPHVDFYDSNRTIANINTKISDLNFPPTDPRAAQSARELCPDATTPWAMENDAIDNFYNPSASWKLEVKISDTPSGGTYASAVGGRYNGRYVRFRITLTRSKTSQSVQVEQMDLSSSKVAAGGGSGDFTGPASSVTDNLLAFANTTGKLGKDSGYSVAGILGVAAAALASHVGNHTNIHGVGENNRIVGSSATSVTNERIAVFDGTEGGTIKEGAGTIADIINTAAVALASHISATTDIHGVGGSTVASAADIEAHAVLTSTHGVSGNIVGTTDVQTLAGKTLTTPTISSFVNATHDHSNAAGGGQIAIASTTGTLAIARGGTNQTAFTASQLVRMNAGGTALESSGKVVGDFAEAAHNHATSDITTGVFGIARGGTNADSFTASQIVRMNAGGTALESSGYVVGDFAEAAHTHSIYVLKAGDTMSGDLNFGGYGLLRAGYLEVDDSNASHQYTIAGGAITTTARTVNLPDETAWTTESDEMTLNLATQILLNKTLRTPKICYTTGIYGFTLTPGSEPGADFTITVPHTSDTMALLNTAQTNKRKTFKVDALWPGSTNALFLLDDTTAVYTVNAGGGVSGWQTNRSIAIPVLGQDSTFSFLQQDETHSGDKTFSGALKVNTITERTAGSGVTIDGVLLKDGIVGVGYGGTGSTSLTGNRLAVVNAAGTAIVSSSTVVHESTNVQFWCDTYVSYGKFDCSAVPFYPKSGTGLSLSSGELAVEDDGGGNVYLLWKSSDGSTYEFQGTQR